jgi:hypothetical protein
MFENSIIEITLDQGITLNESMTYEIKDLFNDIIDKPCGILENQRDKKLRVRPVMLQLGKVSNIKAVAFIVYSSMSYQYVMSSKAEMNTSYNLNVFVDRYEAISWLRSQVENS